MSNATAYSTADYHSRQCDLEQGAYANGGSYYLYNMLFLIDCYLHGVCSEPRMKSSGEPELNSSGAAPITNISTRAPVNPAKPIKAGMARFTRFWQQLIERGKADDRFLREIDKIGD